MNGAHVLALLIVVNIVELLLSETGAPTPQAKGSGIALLVQVAEAHDLFKTFVLQNGAGRGVQQELFHVRNLGDILILERVLHVIVVVVILVIILPSSSS